MIVVHRIPRNKKLRYLGFTIKKALNKLFKFFKNSFKKRDGSGFISKDKLKEVFESLNIDVTEEVINSTIENIDSDGKSELE